METVAEVRAQARAEILARIDEVEALPPPTNKDELEERLESWSQIGAAVAEMMRAEDALERELATERAQRAAWLEEQAFPDGFRRRATKRTS